MKVSVSFLSCKKIISAIKKISLTDTDYIHIDFIDGEFVKGKKIPFYKLRKVNKESSKRLDVHLMTNKLKKYIKKFALFNCEYITFHIEATEDIEKYINLIRSFGIKVGLAINPDTDIEVLKPYLPMIDLVLVMSVVPGYGGQEFIPETINKLKQLKQYINKNKLNVLINIDGGINNKNINKIKPLVDMVVSGSYITNSDDYQLQINTLR